MGEGVIRFAEPAQEALDASRQRCGELAVLQLLQADTIGWRPPTSQSDVVLMAFWLSHVPRPMWTDFLPGMVSGLRIGGALVVVDDQPRPATASEEWVEDGPDAAVRTLADGRRFRIVKAPPDPADLHGQLNRLGLEVSFVRDPEWLIVAARQRRRSDRITPTKRVAETT
ncbi:MAG: hypothetical protein ACRCYQ_07000 [Nocardioides sp.]